MVETKTCIPNSFKNVLLIEVSRILMPLKFLELLLTIEMTFELHWIGIKYMKINGFFLRFLNLSQCLREKLWLDASEKWRSNDIYQSQVSIVTLERWWIKWSQI